MITIIDYGVGNIRAFVNVYKQLNIPVKIAKNERDLEDATRLILPGVGAFDHAMGKLLNSGMLDRINELVLKQEVPVMGICVGMQMLASSSEEGCQPGLDWIKGVVKRFDTSKLRQTTQLPHMGWNNVVSMNDNKLFDNLSSEAKFYFLHSYYFGCDKIETAIASTDYGGQFICAVNHKNIYGVQFHPEKSHHYGAQLLKNFSTV